MVIYGVSAFYPPWELPHGRDLFPIGAAIAWAGRLLRRHKPEWLRPIHDQTSGE